MANFNVYLICPYDFQKRENSVSEGIDTDFLG